MTQTKTKTGKTATASTTPTKRMKVSEAPKAGVIYQTDTTVVHEPLPAKDAVNSKTIWINIAGGLIFIAGIIATATSSGLFVDKDVAALLTGLSGVLLAAANIVTRFYTDRPVTV